MSNGNPVWLDITRLAERAIAGSLTGIDRVELAYARMLLATIPSRTRFVMLGRWSSRLSLLPDRQARQFIESLDSAWRSGHPADCRGMALRLMAMAMVSPGAHDPLATYLLVSHRHLDRPAALRQALRQSGARFVPLIHDLIPLEYPEYGRPGEAERHGRRIATVAALADAVVVNSATTRTSLAPYIPDWMAVHIAPLGVSAPSDEAPELRPRPYFLCIGTIEPRKNHLLLLHIWRRLAAEHGNAAPELLIAGRRGWENENVLDMLDRCQAIRSCVTELGLVSDTRLSALTRGARAVLMPSFAEGFGLPVAEALTHGTPVLCSDIPALREAAGDVPEYLDPLDAVSWQAAVEDYAMTASCRRQAQLARLPEWRPTHWRAHCESVLAFIESPRAVNVTISPGRMPAALQPAAAM